MSSWFLLLTSVKFVLTMHTNSSAHRLHADHTRQEDTAILARQDRHADTRQDKPERHCKPRQEYTNRDKTNRDTTVCLDKTDIHTDIRRHRLMAYNDTNRKARQCKTRHAGKYTKNETCLQTEKQT